MSELNRSRPKCNRLRSSFPSYLPFPRAKRQAHYRATEHNFRRYLTACGLLRPQPEPEFDRFTPLLVAYQRNLLEVRGWAMGTTRHHLDTAYAFLNHAVEPVSGINTISAQAVETFVIAATTAEKFLRVLTVSIRRVFIRASCRRERSRGSSPSRFWTPSTGPKLQAVGIISFSI